MNYTTIKNFKFKDLISANREVNRLEALSGLPKSPMLGLSRANARIDELEKRTALVRTPTLSSPNSGRHSDVPFMSFDTARRLQFSTDGGALTLDYFNDMPPAARIAHIIAGGKLSAPADTKSTFENITDKPKLHDFISLKVFDAFGMASKILWLKVDGKVGLEKNT